MGQTKKIDMEILKFDTKRKRIDKCPCCGHDNKSGGYVPYVGTNAGYCHYCNSTCFPDGNGTIVSPHEIRYINKERAPGKIPHEWHERTLNNYNDNDFVKFLLKRLGQVRTTSIIKRYRLGTYKNDVVFWQIDRDKNVRTGKIMDYNPETGKRGNNINWVHKIQTKLDDFNLKQCFFGEHLLDGNKKPIAIVESEKTACLMSEILPNMLWLSCGGVNGITDDKYKVLIGKEVSLFPDNGKLKEWTDVSLRYFPGGLISKDCEIWYEKNRIDKGDDIADYYLKNHDLKPQKICPEWDSEEYHKIFD